nr:hypothetical protein HmN_000966400 [Hymenolepis microstoma]
MNKQPKAFTKQQIVNLFFVLKHKNGVHSNYTFWCSSVVSSVLVTIYVLITAVVDVVVKELVSKDASGNKKTYGVVAFMEVVLVLVDWIGHTSTNLSILLLFRFGEDPMHHKGVS